MKKEKLIKDEVIHILVGDKTYFLVDSLKSKYGDIKIESIITIKDKKYVLAEDVEQYTDFDKSIKKALNFKPNK